MVSYYKDAFRHYADFQGRAHRPAYWYFALGNFIVAFVLGFVLGFIGGLIHAPSITELAYLYSLAALLPGIAVGVRRLHDTGRSAWWLLIGLIPLVGSIVLLVFLCLRGQETANRWGEPARL